MFPVRLSFHQAVLHRCAVNDFLSHDLETAYAVHCVDSFFAVMAAVVFPIRHILPSTYALRATNIVMRDSWH